MSILERFVLRQMTIMLMIVYIKKKKNYKRDFEWYSEEREKLRTWKFNLQSFLEV